MLFSVTSPALSLTQQHLLGHRLRELVASAVAGARQMFTLRLGCSAVEAPGGGPGWLPSSEPVWQGEPSEVVSADVSLLRLVGQRVSGGGEDLSDSMRRRGGRVGGGVGRTGIG